MHARYYSPWMGRFLSVDPQDILFASKVPQRWSRYAYANNNPLKFVDPDGREAVTAVATGSTFLGSGGSIAASANPVGAVVLVGGGSVALGRFIGTRELSRGGTVDDFIPTRSVISSLHPTCSS